MNDVVNVTLVGVGGQGILLASEVLARAAALAGMDVKKSEIHGMSQRGGSVTSQVRFGKKVHSPIVPFGSTDFLVAFEELEAIRCFPLLAPTGVGIIDKRRITPLTVSSGQQPALPDADKILAELYGDRAIYTNSMSAAKEAGNPRTANMAVVGALSVLLDIDASIWLDALKIRLPEKILDVNIKAFELGRKQVSVHRR